jgi:hypothetical protein
MIYSSSADAARDMAEIRKSRPHSEAKRFGSDGPSPEQRAAYEEEVRQWNRKYRAASAAWRKLRGAT